MSQLPCRIYIYVPIERAHNASPTPIAYVVVVLCPWTVEHVRVVSPPSRDVLRARSVPGTETASPTALCIDYSLRTAKKGTGPNSESSHHANSCAMPMDTAKL